MFSISARLSDPTFASSRKELFTSSASIIAALRTSGNYTRLNLAEIILIYGDNGGHNRISDYSNVYRSELRCMSVWRKLDFSERSRRAQGQFTCGHPLYMRRQIIESSNEFPLFLHLRRWRSVNFWSPLLNDSGISTSVYLTWTILQSVYGICSLWKEDLHWWRHYAMKLFAHILRRHLLLSSWRHAASFSFDTSWQLRCHCHAYV